MTIFTGTGGADIADSNSGTLTGFVGGTVADLQDAVGDSFSPGDGADSIQAGSGDDTLNGSAGIDTMRGGDGNDMFAFTTGPNEADVIDGGDGFDTISVTVNRNFTTATIVSIEALSFSVSTSASTNLVLN